MKRVLAPGLIVLALLVPARPASAQGFFRWLEQLSGPGPFKGAGLELAGFCYGVRKDQQTTNDADAKTDRESFFDPYCGRSARDRVRVMVGLQASFMSGDNTLSYAATVPVDQRDTVKVRSFVGTADIGVQRWLELGAGAGFIRFTNLPVPAFDRAVIEALRVKVKPLLFMPAKNGASQYHREWLELRLNGTFLPSALDGQDFGALPGTFHVDREFLWGYSVVINVLPLLIK